MKYIKLTDGGYQVVDKGLYDALPEDRREELIDGDNPQVKAWLISAERAAAAVKVVAFANAIRTQIAKSQHYLQAARWPIQLASAQAIKAGKPSPFDTATMSREARLRGRGETVEQLAEKVLGNSMVFASVGAAVDGIESAALDEIAAYKGTNTSDFDRMLGKAKATALTEFLDIFGAVYGPEKAKAMASQFFGV